MRQEFRHGALGVYDFDSDEEIEIEIEDITSLSNAYLDLPAVIRLRDWLTAQIKRKRSAPK